jgi:hypothetical protein
MRKGHLPPDGGNVYNRSVATRQHLRQDRERRMERTEEVDIHRLLEATQGLALRWANKDDSRIVHDHVDLTEVQSCRSHDFLDLFGNTYIAGQNHYVLCCDSTFRDQMVFCPLKLFNMSRNKHKTAPQERHPPSDGVSQASRSTSYEYYLPLQQPG